MDGRTTVALQKAAPMARLSRTLFVVNCLRGCPSLAEVEEDLAAIGDRIPDELVVYLGTRADADAAFVRCLDARRAAGVAPLLEVDAAVDLLMYGEPGNVQYFVRVAPRAALAAAARRVPPHVRRAYGLE